ncbi:hypothetical protein ACFVXG_38020 [Kitasatospora sp. NPDC058162]|uniref:hypothetical protein n=1 Tax=Kitasatospora sp. NPDC058162 TaxID=3346362 RepID=UPI0036DA643A
MRFFRSAMNALRVQGPAEYGVVHRAGGLEGAGQIVLRIAPAGRALHVGRRARTWLSLSPAGDRALRDEVARLKRLIHRIEQADPAPES